MAKIVGIIGTGSGRLGNAVLSKGDNGTTVARTYQSQVRNPRTIAQRKQRAKMNLAGQLSKLTPSSSIIGFHQGNNRNNRSAFVASLLNACTVATDSNGDYQATIVPDRVTFAQGNVPLAYGTWEEYSMDLLSVDRLGYVVQGDTYWAASIYYQTAQVMGIDADVFCNAVNPKGIYGELVTFVGCTDNGCDYVLSAAKIFYDTLNVKKPGAGLDYLQVVLPEKPIVGQKTLVFRTPFILTGQGQIPRYTDAKISGNNIIASEKTTYMELISSYYYPSQIPSDTVMLFLRNSDVKWGNSHYQGTLTYTE